MRLPGWYANAYPDAGEAVAYYVPPTPSEPSGKWSSLSDDERAAENERRAVRRARGEMRRYMVSNGLRFMWVLTLGGDGLHEAEGRREVMRRCGLFARRLRDALGGEPFPYLYSPELHPGGHGWHVNFFVPMKISIELVRDLWSGVESGGDAPCGFVFVSDWVAKVRRADPTMSVRSGVRAAARYAAKYASKDWSADVLAGRQHRYEVAEGFAPTKVCRWSSRREWIEQALLIVFGGEIPAEVWRSEELKDWMGPPVFTWRFR